MSTAHEVVDAIRDKAAASRNAQASIRAIYLKRILPNIHAEIYNLNDADRDYMINEICFELNRWRGSTVKRISEMIWEVE